MKIDWQERTKTRTEWEAHVGNLICSVEFCGAYTGSIHMTNLEQLGNRAVYSLIYSFRIFSTGHRTLEGAKQFCEDHLAYMLGHVDPMKSTLEASCGPKT